MNKYYYLDKYKSWKGPYSYPQVLFFCLIGTIKPYTYLWHNNLSNDIGIHPSSSIYARKKAEDFRLFPIWIFRHNLSIIGRNLLIKWSRKFKKRDNWEAFVAKPIEHPSSLTSAKRIYLIPSIVAIHDFAAPGDFTIKLTYFEASNDSSVKQSEFPIQLSSDKKPGIPFEITMAQPPGVGGVEYMESYGLHRKLLLTGINENIAISENSVFDFFTRYPYAPQILKGRFRQVNTVAAHNYKDCYNRLIVKMYDDKVVGPQDVIASSGQHLYDNDKLNVHPSLMGVSFKTGGSFTDVVIGSLHYSLYDTEGDILVIDGNDKEELINFKQKAEIIRVALAVMSGKFYGGECSYVTSQSNDFSYIDGVWYEIEKPSVLSDRRTINLQLLRSVSSGKNEYSFEKFGAVDHPVEASLFSSLCDILRTNETRRHAANLVISGMGNNNPLQQGALYSVALEALTADLSKAKSEELKPISDRQISREFVSKLKDVLDEYRNKIPEQGQNILEKNIDGINKPTNRDKLIRTFELYGIPLSSKDKETIDKRNDYLHGRNPLDLEQSFELTRISLRLHTLIVSLLLKSVGYTGHIVNLDVHIYLNNEKEMIKMVTEQHETYCKLVEQIEEARRKGDEILFTKLKSELSVSIENDPLANLFRII